MLDKKKTEYVIAKLVDVLKENKVPVSEGIMIFSIITNRCLQTMSEKELDEVNDLIEKEVIEYEIRSNGEMN